MRKKVASRGISKPSGTMPGRAAAPAFLTLPKLSPDIQLEINAVAGDSFALDMLAMLSNCIDLSMSTGNLADIMNPADTIDKLLCSRVSGWIYRGHDYLEMEQVFYPELSILHPEVAKQEFSDTFYPEGPVLFVHMTSEQNRECDASYLRTLPEDEARAILDIIDESPVYVMTPRELLNQVSCNYWMGSPDETDRVEEIRSGYIPEDSEDVDEEQRDDMEQEISEFCPITRDDFNVAYPKWLFSKSKKYSGVLPVPVQKLKAANKKYFAAWKKYKFSREYINGTLPGVRLIGLEAETLQAEGLFNTFWDDTIEEQYNNYGGTIYLCPFCLPFKTGGYDEAVIALEALRTYLDCMNAVAELLIWLQSKSPEKLKVTA